MDHFGHYVALFFVALVGYFAYLGLYRAVEALIWIVIRRARVIRHKEIVAYLQKHPRYPFALPIVDTWAAGEFVCEKCGKNSYFSMVRLEPHQVPPELRRQAAMTSSVAAEHGHGVHSEGVFHAPLIVQCQHCRSLLANGDASCMYDSQGNRR